MEFKNKLDKPYTEKQRMDFIVSQNHQLGYEIRETSEALEAWGYTEEEKQEQEKQRRNQEIDSKIAELQEMCLSEVIQGNIENIKTYQSVIESLKENKSSI